MDFCRKGAIPLTFQEKMRARSASGENEELSEGGCVILIALEILRLLDGGGLISLLIVSCGCVRVTLVGRNGKAQ
jgi:hypothetical protein